MANTKITELSAVTALAGTDVFPVVDVSASTTNKVSVEDLLRNAPDGSAGAPSIANAGDQDTGILFPADNSVGVSTGGTQRLVIDSSGQVGIGTTTVNNLNKLHLQAASASLTSTSNQSVLLVENNNNTWVTIGSPASNYSGILFADPDDADVGQVRYNHNGNSLEFIANAQERLRIDSSGRVGIGTSSPGSFLSLEKSSAGSYTGTGSTVGDKGIDIYNTQTTNDNSYAGISLRVARSSGNIAGGSINLLSTGSGSGSFAFVTRNANIFGERMRITHDGNVGIGTSAPDTKLDVNGTIKTETISYANNQNQPYLIAGTANYTGATTNWGTYGFQHRFKSNATGNPRVTIDTVSGEAFCVTDSRNVGIGTNDPQSVLTLRDSTPRLTFEPTADTQTCRIQFATTDGTVQSTIQSGGSLGSQYKFVQGTSEVLRIDSSGNVGIGTSTPATTLTVTQSVDDSSDGIRLTRLNEAASYTQWIDTGARYNIGYSNPSSADPTESIVTLTSTGNVGIGGTTSPASATKSLAIFNGTAPTGSVADGVVLYAEDVSSSSELKVRDEAGNVTTLSPHNFDLIPEGPSEDMAWSYYSEKDGKRINVDMLKAVRLLEQLTGEQLVFTG